MRSATEPTIPDVCGAQNYTVVWEGYLKVPFARETLFRLGSADGAVFWLNGQRVIDNDEPHDYTQQIATVKLEPGIYAVRLAYTSFRHPGQMELLYSNPASEFCPFYPHDLFCEEA